jgi:hypothetical protein
LTGASKKAVTSSWSMPAKRPLGIRTAFVNLTCKRIQVDDIWAFDLEVAA